MRLLDKIFGTDKTISGLEQLLSKLATNDSPKLRDKFYRELLSSKLYVATPGTAAEVPANCPITGDKEEGIGFIATSGPDGKPAMIVFTGQSGFESWKTNDCECIEMPSEEIFKLALNNQVNSIIINPRGP